MKKLSKRLFLVAAAVATIVITGNLNAQYPYGILPQRSNMKQAAYDAYVNFRDNHLTSNGTADPQNMLRHLHPSGETRVEYQTFALMVAIYNDDWTTFRKLWRYCNSISAQNTKSNATLVYPWYANSSGTLVGKGIKCENSELVNALYEASVRDPNAVDHTGRTFRELAGIAAEEIWYHTVCHEAPHYSGIFGGAEWKCGDANQFIYLHYASPWGYFNRWAEASNDYRWLQPYTLNGRNYPGVVNAIRPLFESHINDYGYKTFCHTMDFNGQEAGANGSDDANSTWFGFGQARGLYKNAVTYLNWGNATDKNIVKFMADFFIDKTGGNPANIANGYTCTTGGGSGDPKPSMVGPAGLAGMIDGQYQGFVNSCWDWMVNNIDNFQNDYRESLMGAVYMLSMAGELDLSVNSGNYLNLSTNSVGFTKDAGNTTVSVTSNVNWTVSDNQAWISVSPTSGSNNGSIAISVTSNTGSTARTGTVTISGNNVSNRTIEVVQEGISDVAVTGVSLNKSSVTLSPGSTEQLTATVTPSNASNKSVTWSSSNAAVASVSSSGLVTANSDGTATITVTTVDGGFTASASITVQTGDQELTRYEAENASLYNATIGNSINGYSGTGYITLTKGDVWANVEFTVNSQTATTTDVIIRYISGNNNSPRLVVNGANQTITLAYASNFTDHVVPNVALNAGNNTIRIENGKNMVIDYIDVGTGGSSNVPVTGVTVDQSSLTLAEGATAQLSETVLPSDASDKSVAWATSNASVASVNSSGLVTAISAGTATITVTTNDGGFSATTSVTVESSLVPVTGVSVSPTSLSLLVGETSQLAETVAPSDATDKSVAWSSSAPLVASVSSTGLVTANAEGTATITVTTNDGNFTASTSVLVESEGGGITRFEAEDANLSNASFTASGSASGTGYVTFQKSGIYSFAEFTVNATAATTVDVDIRYISGLSTINLKINGATQVLSMPNTSNFADYTVTGVSLNSGANTIRLDDAKNYSFDYIEIESSAVYKSASIAAKDDDAGMPAVYPNPVENGMLYISKEADVLIYNVTGSIMLVGKGRKIDVSALQPGLYFVKAGNSPLYKVIIQ